MLPIMPAKAPTLFPSHGKLLAEMGVRLHEARLRRRFSVTLVAARANISRKTLYSIEQGDPAVTMGNYLRVLAVFGLEKDLGLLAAADPVGRRLQDAALGTPRRAAKTKRPPALDEDEATGSTA